MVYTIPRRLWNRTYAIQNLPSGESGQRSGLTSGEASIARCAKRVVPRTTASAFGF
jgi:hypothetical protein